MQSVSTIQLAALVPLAAVSVDVIRRLVGDYIERKGYPLPPGPTPIPLIGSALSVDFHEPFRTYTEWQAKYGDIMYIRLLDTDVVVLNSPAAATELLERRSQTYSDRPFIASVEPYGHDSTFAFSQYGEHLRLCRRIFHQTFRADAAASFQPMQVRKARQLILSMMDTPSDFFNHYTTFNSSVIMSSVYDYDPKPRDDPMVSIINSFIDASFPALMPERATLLKVFPFLLHIPNGLPGAWIRREAKNARELGVKMVETPYQYVRRRLECKEHVNPSMVSNHIPQMETLEDPHHSRYEKALKETSSTAFLAGVETTSSTLMVFTLAMVKNPRIWKRAQADIDAVVGTRRLPTFDDRSSLPYVDAILREALRWRPSVPLGVPHATNSSDIYNGFYIPKGATVIANTWAMTRDETRYPKPEEYIPERFLDVDGMLTNDTASYSFGFGRRICPGRHVADASMWIAAATMLATLEFNPAKDADGKDVEFEAEFMNGMARHPLAFPCCITPRAHINKSFIERAFVE